MSAFPGPSQPHLTAVRIFPLSDQTSIYSTPELVQVHALCPFHSFAASDAHMYALASIL